MGKVLLVDTNRAAYTFYARLVADGHEVWVVGGDPAEPLAKISQNYVQIDYSDASRLAALVEERSFDFVVPGCTDVSYKVCAEISQGRFPGIDSVQATRAINDKAEFRRLAEELGISVPKVLSLDQAVGMDAVIVKPVDSFSGRGTSIVRQAGRGELSNAFADACGMSKTEAALIEEFVEGQLYSHSAFVSKGRVVADFVVREDCSVSPFTVDTSRVDFDFSAPVLDRLRRDALALVGGLNLNDGLLHSQFILSEDRYWIIETTRRCPGDLYALLIEMSTGYPYGASYAAPFVGEAQMPREVGCQQDMIIRHTVTSRDGESLWGFSFKQPLDLRFFVPLAVAGDRIEQSPYGRAGLFFIAAHSEEERESLYRSLLQGELYGFSRH
jgi:biotin carboxylase